MTKSASPQKPIKRTRTAAPARRTTAPSRGKATATPEASATEQFAASGTKSPKTKKIRKEELSFSVTEAFRKKFKQAAKEAGQKKFDFLQMLLGHWEEKHRQPPSGDRL